MTAPCGHSSITSTKNSINVMPHLECDERVQIIIPPLHFFAVLSEYECTIVVMVGTYCNKELARQLTLAKKQEETKKRKKTRQKRGKG